MPTITTFFSQYLPETLQSEGERVSASLLAVVDDKQQDKLYSLLNQSPALAEQCVRSLVGSAFILDSCCRDPNILFHWLLVAVPFAPLSVVRIV